jgi:hypothetical protein
VPNKPTRQDKAHKPSFGAIDRAQPQSEASQEKGQSLKGILTNLISEAKMIVKALPESGGYPDPKFEGHVTKIKDTISEFVSTSYLEDAASSTRKEISALLEGIPNKLEEFCKASGFNLYGAFPDHIIDGTTYLAFDITAHRVTLNDMTFPLFPFDDLILRVSKEVLNQKKRSFQVDRFLDQLWNGYLRVLMSQGVPKEDCPGKRVSVNSLLPELALSQQSKTFLANPLQKNYKSYSQHALRADLFLLLSNNQRPVFKNHLLKLEPPSVAEHGIFMFLPSLGRCAFLGHLVFE